MKPAFKALSFAAALAAAGAASAERPANLGGSTWAAHTHRDAEQFVVTMQAGPGAPGAADCQVINGHFNISSPLVLIRGWYCPSTGRVHVVHKNIGTGDAVRMFTDDVSDDVLAQPLYMAGTMTVLISPFGDLGEYNFSAVR